MLTGKLFKRIKIYAKRLCDDIYDYPLVFEKEDGWPGDFPGRTLLALSCLFLSLDDTDSEKNVIKEKINVFLNNLYKYVNEDFYFGPKINLRQINEQQLSGNSWYFRGLCRYYEISHDQNIFNKLKSISNKLLIPLADEYRTYPIHKREENGGVSGHILKDSNNNWILSSDVGCAFILLDGYVSIYRIIKDEKLKKAIEKIIDIFADIDVVNLMFQTHATLTATRAILNFYEMTKNEKYLKLAIKLFDIYQREGMSDDYENINWFLKNNGYTWTEPCCVIDSFILSKHLYLITKEIKYLKLYNRIYINGLRTFQRNNGGAGCTTISRNGNGEMRVWLYEAYFCCTLREGEGFYELSRSFVKNQNSYTFLIDESMEDECIKADIDLYEKGIFHLEFKKDLEVVIYVPDGFKSKEIKQSNFLKLNGNIGQVIDVHFELDVHRDGIRCLYGDMLLTQKNSSKTRMFIVDQKNYSLISNSLTMSEMDLNELVQKI